MDSILRGLSIYLFLIVLFRIAGTRTLAEMTSFDFVLLLIISEATQQAMIDNDNSMTNAALIIVTLIGADIAMSFVKERWKKLEHAIDGTPVIIVEHGRPKREVMQKTRVDEEDVLAFAREAHGLERMEQIKYAVLETSGSISIVPYRGEGQTARDEPPAAPSPA
jgi:uncharacterized membrane protein YcaP (DUF421 family)